MNLLEQNQQTLKMFYFGLSTNIMVIRELYIYFLFVFYKLMNYRSNFGVGQDYNNKLGYSNVSRNFNKSLSPKHYPQDHGSGMGELQFMIENERKKFREAKDRFENDLDNQRKKRIEFQNKLIKLKDEFSRKQVALSQSQFKINNLLHQNQDLAMENQRFKSQLARIQELYGGKIHQLQTQLIMETKNFQETTLQYNQQFEKFKKQGQEYVESLTFQMERKIKGLEERLKVSESQKKDFLQQNKKLNDLLISNRLQFEEQLRDLKNKARDQQIKKAQYLSKTYEQKLKMVEDGKEGLNRKIQQLLRLVQDRDSRLADQERQFQDQIVKIHQDSTDLQQHNNQLNYLVSKLKAELSDKDNMIGRSVNDNDGELKALRQQLEAKKNELNQLQATIKELRLAMKDIDAEGQRKRRELAQRCYSLENEARRYKQQYTKLADILKSKINSTIDNVSFPRRDK